MFLNSALNSLVSRRGFVGGTVGGLAAAGLTACGVPDATDGAGGSSPGSEGVPPSTRAGGLDLSNPADNLYAFGKIWGTYAEKPVYSGFQGVQFARIGVNKLVPLCGYVGFGNIQCKIDENGHLWLRGTEAGYFTDLASGEIIDHWDNPYSGERVEVFPFISDRFRGRLTEEMPRFSLGNAPDDNTLMNAADARPREDGKIPFVLPFQKFHDQYLLAWEYAHEYTNPVTPEAWPKASTGPKINPSEHFIFYIPAAGLEDRSLPSVRFHAGFMRTSPWWPWMRMGQTPVRETGALFGRMHSFKITGELDNIPRVVLERLERDRPDILEPQTDWADTQPDGTWEAFAEEVPPEV